MRILFLGYTMDSKYCIDNKGASIAGNKMQLSILKGLKKRCGNNLDIVSIPPIAPYPQVKKIFISYPKSEISKKIFAKFIPFINIPYIKQITQILNTFLYGFFWGFKYRVIKEKIVYCYNSHPNVSLTAALLKKVFRCKIVCILADPPIDVSHRLGFSKIAWSIMEKISEKNIELFDGIVAVNKYAAEKYAKSLPYIIVEGGIDVTEIGEENKYYNEKESKEKVIVFSGALYEYNGLKLLIDAMKLIKERSIKLHIYGDGPLKEYVLSELKDDSRIIYKGLVSNETVLKAQKEADLLVNPRPTRELISLYTFPSKLIEYMVSGTPVISTNLNGITKEYFPYLFILDNESPECMASMIHNVILMNKRELLKFGHEARSFIINNKNWDIQCKKIYEFSLLLNKVKRL